MPKPAILAVDDEPIVLNAVDRDLRSRFGGEYRIIKASSGAEGLDVVRSLKMRGSALALFIVDQRMPEMTGIEFLAEARKLYPEARKVLLTAYADTDAAIQSINTIGLDSYLMKPWDPPEDALYPILDDLLDEWAATVPVPYDGIRVAGTLWSASSHDVKDFLARNRISYRWLDIEKDSVARELTESVTQGDVHLPVVFLPDGEALVAPDLRTLADTIDLQTEATEDLYDLVIVGGGPAGLGAAVNGCAEGLKTLLIEREATGGQAGTSSRIENYLGFPKGVSGTELARRATAQAQRLGAEILLAQEATGVSVEDPYRFVELSDGTRLGCKALLLATGVSVRRLKVPGIEALTGAGVYYGAALTEAVNYRDQSVVIVGGANSAGQAAMLYSRYASTVTMLVRSSSLDIGMSTYLVNQIDDVGNIDVRLRTEVAELHGEDRLEAVTIMDKDSRESETLPAAAMAILIGAVPQTEFVAGLVERSGAGFIKTGLDLISDDRRPRGWKLKRYPFYLEASVPGIFAAGDVRYGALTRVSAAVGSGGIAVGLINEYLKTI